MSDILTQFQYDDLCLYSLMHLPHIYLEIHYRLQRCKYESIYILRKVISDKVDIHSTFSIKIFIKIKYLFLEFITKLLRVTYCI